MFLSFVLILQENLNGLLSSIFMTEKTLTLYMDEDIVSSSILSSLKTIEIHLECKNLPSLDLMTESDPKVTMYYGSIHEDDINKLKKIDKTEIINNKDNCEFHKKITFQTSIPNNNTRD